MIAVSTLNAILGYTLVFVLLACVLVIFFTGRR